MKTRPSHSFFYCSDYFFHHFAAGTGATVDAAHHARFGHRTDACHLPFVCYFHPGVDCSYVGVAFGAGWHLVTATAVASPDLWTHLDDAAAVASEIVVAAAEKSLA